MGSRLANPFSFSHVDVGDAFQFINHIMAERRRNTTGRSGVVVGRWRSKPQVLGSTPASVFSFSDVGDAFVSYNRAGWSTGRALAFKTIGRGFAPR